MCYLKLGQHGWLPLANVDPGGSLSHPSFKMWYEHDESYNEEGAKRFKDSPRLYNYNKRAAQKLNPHRPDNTRALGEFRCWEKKVDKPMQDKITNVDGAVGRDGWRAHVTLGNGVVRWTDDVFDWQQSNMLNPTGVNENGKSMYIYPNELEPMYSSFSPDKIYRWKPPEKKKRGKKKKEKKMSKEEIVKINEIRRQNMETRGSVNGCKPSPRKHRTLTIGNQERDGMFNRAGTGGLRMERVLDMGSSLGVGGGLRRASPTSTKGSSTLTAASTTMPPKKTKFFQTAPAKGGENAEENVERKETPKTDNRLATKIATEAVASAVKAMVMTEPGIKNNENNKHITSEGIPASIPKTIVREDDDDTVVSNITGLGM